jgi:hypothetical protein
VPEQALLDAHPVSLSPVIGECQSLLGRSS